MGGKGGKKKGSKYKKQKGGKTHKKLNLSLKELRENIISIVNQLESLVLRCPEKTELGCFLASVSSSFCFEDIEVDGEESITIEDELVALGYAYDLKKTAFMRSFSQTERGQMCCKAYKLLNEEGAPTPLRVILV